MPDKNPETAGRLGMTRRRLVADNTKNKEVANPYLVYEYEDSGVRCYNVRRSHHGGIFGAEGMAHARVAVTEINMPVQDIQAAWFKASQRAAWDKTLTHASVLESLSDSLECVRLKGQPGYFVPARDYILHAWRAAGAAAGLSDFNTAVVVSADASDEAPAHWTSVRGQMNSVLVLQPRGASTEVMHICEFNYAGWVWSYWVDIYAGRIARSLQYLKEEMEGNDDGEDDGSASVEEIARRRFEKKMERERSDASLRLGEDVTMGRVALQETLDKLQARLADVKATEARDNIPMAELKARIRDDIM